MLNFKPQTMNKIIFWILIVVFLSSCFNERIDLDLNEDNKKIVVVGWISNLDQPQFVTISETSNYLGESTTNFVAGATVTLGDEVSTYAFEEGENGKYYLPQSWTPRIGNDYQLKVITDEGEFTANHSMNPCPEIEDLRIIERNDENDSIPEYELNWAFQEIPGEGDAYYAIDYLKGTIDGDSLRNGGYANDEFVDGEYFDDIVVTESDRLFQSGDTAILELYSVGKETVDFLYDIESEVFRGSPFDPPPANVRTNFSGGAVGYFIISAAKQVEVFIE